MRGENLKTKVSNLKNYAKYSSGIIPVVLFTLLYFIVLFTYFYLILHKVFVCLVIVAMIYPYAICVFRKSMIERTIKKLELQFGEALRFISSSLSAGSTIENSFFEFASASDRYSKADLSLITKEFTVITNSMNLHESAAEAFRSFADRSGSRDIKIFSLALCQICSTGGDIVGLVRNTVASLRIKRETDDEIDLILATPKYNHGIITIMPIMIVILMNFISPDYMVKVYSGPGQFVAVLSASVIVIAYIIGSRISNVKM